MLVGLGCRMHKLQRDIGERERDMGTNLDALRERHTPQNLERAA